MKPFAAACLFTLAVAAAQPAVTKVEPPNWWAAHSVNPVSLLVRGSGLHGAKAAVKGRGFRISNLRVNQAGTYLFLDLTIPRSARPGPVELSVTTSAGSAKIPFDITAPLPRPGRFAGISEDDIIYLIMPDRFADGDPSNNEPEVSRGLYDRAKSRYYHGGDLQGVIDRLPYLKDLGITAIWLNPIYDNNNKLNTREVYDGHAITDYHGYGAVDFYAVEERLGTVDKFRELVDKAHAAGIKIIQDQVANHTGPFHPWTTDPPKPTWFNGTVSNHLDNTWQTWTLMDPHSPPHMRKATLDGWFINILPDLNQDDPDVARYIIQNTLWWVGMTGLDAIRQDTLPYVPRTFWRDWMGAIKREYPTLRVIGELYDGNPTLVSFFEGGVKRWDGIDSGIDTLFDFPLYYPLRRAFANGQSVREIPTMLAHDHLYQRPEKLVTFFGLHDVARFMNEKGATIAGLKMAFTLLMTTRGTPLIYYGDEIAMPGGNDPDNRRDFPGGFPVDSRDAFTPAGRTPDEQTVFTHVRTLTRLRATNDCLRRGKIENLAATDEVYAFARKSNTCTAIVIFNNGAKPMNVQLPITNLNPAATDQLGAVQPRIQRDRLEADLPPRTAALFISTNN
jgi:neopullulanase